MAQKRREGGFVSRFAGALGQARETWKTGDARPGYALTLALAWLAEIWQRAWPRFWPVTLAIGAFLAAALYGVLAWLPTWLHVIVLLLYGAGLTVLVYRVVATIPWPDLAAARHRLERESGLAHRPLTALADTPFDTAGGDRGTEALWHQHQAAARAALGRLRIGRPRASLEKQDPYGLRAVLAFVLLIGLIGLEAPGTRLLSGFAPGREAGGITPSEVALWITPPDYSGAAPLYLGGHRAPSRSAEPLEVLEGSRLLAHVTGGSGQPQLEVDQARLDFESLGGSSYQLETRLDGGTSLVIRQGGRVLFERPLLIDADTPPEIVFAERPLPTGRKALKVSFEARDDFGVADVRARIERADKITGEKLVLDLPINNPHEADVTGTGYHDLTSHPWAGLPTKIRLIARDGKKQQGVSAPELVVLPERIFRHPVARAIVEQRKRLVTSPKDAQSIAGALETIASAPEEYGNDSVVSLSLSAARARLLRNPGAETRQEIMRLLWDAALRIEEGEVGSAEQRLREARERLQEALADETVTPETLDQLMDELKNALDNYLTTLARTQSGQGAQPGASALADEGETIRPEDLQRMMEQIQNLSRTGAREAAAKMLAQLQDILENLRTADAASEGPLERFAGEALKRLEGLTRRQQELMDENFRAQQENSPGAPFETPPGVPPGTGAFPPFDTPLGQRFAERFRDGFADPYGQPGNQPPEDAGEPGGDGAGGTPDPEAAAAQENLRRQLGDFMRQLGERAGEIPESLGRAERSMRGAGEALGAGERQPALDQQGQALDQLRTGAEELREALNRQLAEQGQGRAGDGQDEGYGGGAGSVASSEGEDVEIPEEAEVQRAWQILQELRRRAGDRTRPEEEREYLDRLLTPF